VAKSAKLRRFANQPVAEIVQFGEPQKRGVNMAQPNVKLQGARAADNVGCAPAQPTEPTTFDTD
jgi:hypothetical protein